jgi:hypothetical protein
MSNWGTNAKYICNIIAGKGTFSFSELDSYEASFACSLAGYISKLAINVPPDNRKFIAALYFSNDYEGYEETLEVNRIVGFRKPVEYRRGRGPYCCTTLCHTLAPTGSDYANMHTMRIIRKLIRAIHNLQLSGKSSFVVKEGIEDLLNNWLSMKYLNMVTATYSWASSDELIIRLVLGIQTPMEHISVEARIGPVQR